MKIFFLKTHRKQFAKKWQRRFKRCTIFIQWNNAKPHLKGGDQLSLEEGFRDGWKIQLNLQQKN